MLNSFLRIAGPLLILLMLAGHGLAQSTGSAIEIRQLPPDKIFVSLTDEQLHERMKLLIGYSIAVVVASIVGGYLPEKLRLTHTRLQVLMSLVGGMMLGVALFHLLYHALIDSPRDEMDDVMTSMALGILIMFLLLRAFNFHKHEVTPVSPGGDAGLLEHGGCEHGGHDHSAHDHSAHAHGGPHHDHGQHHDLPAHGHAPQLRPGQVPRQTVDSAQPADLQTQKVPSGKKQADVTPASETVSATEAVVGTDPAVLNGQELTSQQLFKSRYSWMGIALGLGLHSIMDGVALTASLLRQGMLGDTDAVGFWGLATFLAILLHKPLDAISITSVMSASGWSRRKCTLVNVSFAMMCPLGALLAWWGIVGTHSHVYIVSQLLAFSAGIFLCIALSDLLPEMQFHAHNQGALTVALLVGLGLAWGLMFINPAHPL